jgi:GTP:adenosylcobinamide-phosphate guanylyltransferase
VAVNVILLAGQANDGPLKDESTATNEALIDIGGRPMIQYVIDGLRQSRHIGRIVVVSPPGEIEPHVSGEQLEFVPSGAEIVDNIRAGGSRLPQDEQVLIATCDIPLIKGEIVDGLIDLCRSRPGAELYYPIVEKQLGEAKYPFVTRTYVTLKEGVYTGGNLFLIEPRIIEPTAPKVRAFLQNRKNPFKLAKLVGLTFLFKFLLKVLTLKEAEEAVSRLWGVRGAVIVCPYPEVGIDVDKPSDLHLARAVLL